MISAEAIERRVLVLTPTGRDAAVACEVLAKAGVLSEECQTMEELCQAMAEGGGAVLLADEALRGPALALLIETLSKQPHWSDIPLLVLTGHEAESQAEERRLVELTHAAKVFLLERPLKMVTLISAVQAALRGRERQYELRRRLLEQEQTALVLLEAGRRKDEFLAMLAHELRNPLTPLRNGVYLLTSRGNDPAIAERVLEMMKRGVDHIVRLVDDLLDVSRITQGKIQLRKEPVGVQDLVRRAVETIQPVVHFRNQELTVSLPSEPVGLEGDPVRLTQVIGNLLQNATKYTPEGGHIWLTVEREGQEAVIKVRDNGVGIPRHMLAAVFDLFTQVDRSLDRSEGGLGLGLTLVQSLVKMHGGTVEARSAGPSQGSEFIVRLPALRLPDQERPGSQVRERPQPTDSPRLRVLVVDDSADIAQSLAMSLRIDGHIVEMAHDGPAALEALRMFGPDVALLDIGLPGMDGYELARRIRGDPQSAHLRLVALTGYGQEKDLRLSQEAGFDYHLVKPVDPEQLESILVLGRR